jgi:hypothetical protein
MVKYMSTPLLLVPAAGTPSLMACLVKQQHPCCVLASQVKEGQEGRGGAGAFHGNSALQCARWPQNSGLLC